MSFHSLCSCSVDSLILSLSLQCAETCSWADESGVQTFGINVLAVNDPPVTRLECPLEMRNPRFATLECSSQCVGRYVTPSLQSVLYCFTC
jgi:hypothetical protein